MSQKQVMPKSEDLSRSLEINAIWTFDTEFPTIFNKLCTYITFKSAVKHRYLYVYIYPYFIERLPLFITELLYFQYWLRLISTSCLQLNK